MLVFGSIGPLHVGRIRRRRLTFRACCRQSTWVAQGVAYASMITIVALLSAASAVPMTLVLTWAFLKSTNIMRLPFTLHRVFISAEGPFQGALAPLASKRGEERGEAVEGGFGEMQTQPRAA